MTSRTISLSESRYAKLIETAKQHGYKVQRGPGSQLGEYIESLIDYDPVNDYNAIFDGLKAIGLEIASSGDSWHYRIKRGQIVRGFDSPESALIAAAQSMMEQAASRANGRRGGRPRKEQS